MPTHHEAVAHIAALGFSPATAQAVAGMDLDSEADRPAHYAHILECDRRDLAEWIGSPDAGEPHEG